MLLTLPEFMSRAADFAFVNLAKVDKEGVASSTRLSEIDRRHVRLTTIRNSHRQHSAPKLRRQQDHENSFMLTSIKTPINDPKCESHVRSELPSQVYRDRPTHRNANTFAKSGFDKLTFKVGSSLDRINTPQIEQDLNFLRHILETNRDYVLLQAAYQHDAILYGLLAMTTIYQDSTRGEEASQRSLIYKNKAIHGLIPILGQNADALVDVRIAAVAALTTIDLLEIGENAGYNIPVVHRKGLRAALDAQSSASSFPRQVLYQEQPKLNRAIEWLLLIFSVLNSNLPQPDPAHISGGHITLSGIQLGTSTLAEIIRIFADLSSASLAADLAFSNQSVLHFSLGNSEATEEIGSQVSKLERSVVKILSTTGLGQNVRHLVEIIGFAILLYISIFLRHVPTSAALNHALANKAIQILRIILSQNVEIHNYLLCVDGRLLLFAVAMLGHHVKKTESQIFPTRNTLLHQWQHFFSLLCSRYNAYTSESLLAIILDLVSPTRKANKDIQQAFEIQLAWQESSRPKDYTDLR